MENKITARQSSHSGNLTKIQNHRLYYKLTLSKMANKAGVNIKTIMGAESGRPISLLTAIAISNAIGKPFDELFMVEE